MSQPDFGKILQRETPEQDRESALAAFEEAWKGDSPPGIEDYHCGGSDTELLKELVLIDLENRIKHGEPSRVEEYVHRYPVLDTEEATLELIRWEIQLRKPREPGLSSDEYISRFPQFIREWQRRLPSSPEPTSKPVDPTLARGDAAPTAAQASFSEYQILEELGRGSMGIVHKALHIRLNRIVAIKQILAGHHADAQQMVRFLSEAEAVAKLAHPNIVRLYDCGQLNGLPFFTLEHISGGSLADRLGESPLVPEEAVRLTILIADGIHHSHQQGIIHRDLKPANVLMTEDNQPKITDFGLVKRIEVEGGLTSTGAVLGTPSYMAPEQARGIAEAIGPGVDIYALGAILYECLTGRPPFRGATTWETLTQVIHVDPVSPRQLQPKVPRDLETICLTALQKEPEQRYSSAAAMADDLRRFQKGQPILARRTSLSARAWKWLRRYPAAASLLFVMMLIPFLLVGGLLWHSARLKTELSEQIGQLNREISNKNRALREARYGHDLQASHLFLKQGQVDNALAQIEAYGKEESKDLRGFVWRYLQHQGKTLLWERQISVAGASQLHFHPKSSQLIVSHKKTGAQVLSSESGEVEQTLPFAIENVPVFPLNGKEIHWIDKTGQEWVWDMERQQRKPGRKLDLSGSVLLTHASNASILVGAKDQSVQIWENEQKAPIRILTQDGTITAVTVSPTGAFVLIATAQHPHYRVAHYDRRTGATRIVSTHPKRIQGITISPSGRRYALMDGGNEVMVGQEGQGDWRAGGHFGPVRAMAFSAGDRFLATGGDSGTIRIWDVEKRSRFALLSTGGTPVQSLAFSPNGSHLACLDGKGNLYFHNVSRLREGRAVASLSAPGTMAQSPDGRYLGLSDGSDAIILDSRSGAIVSRFRGGSFSAIYSMALSSEAWVAIGWGDGTIRLWNFQTDAVMPLIQGHAGPVHDLCFLPSDSQALVSAGEDAMVVVWDLKKQSARTRCRGHSQPVNAISLNRNGSLLASGSSREQEVRLWEVSTGRMLDSWRMDNPISDVAMGRNGKYVFVTGAKLNHRLELTPKRTFGKVSPHFGGSSSVDVASQKGSYAFGIDYGFALFERETKLESDYDCIKMATTGHRAYLSPDGRALTVGGRRGPSIFDTQNWTVRRALSHHTHPIVDVAFAPGGDTLLTASQYKAIRVRKYYRNILGVSGNNDRIAWEEGNGPIARINLSTQRQSGFFKRAHPLPLIQMRQSKNGSVLAAGTTGGSIWVWDNPSQRFRGSLYRSKKAQIYWEVSLPVIKLGGIGSPRFEAPIEQLTVHPQGKAIVACSEGSLYLWDLTRTDKLPQKEIVKPNVGALAYHPNGSQIAVGIGKEIWLWRPMSDTWELFAKQENTITCCAIAPNGQWLAVGDDSWRITLRDLTGKTREAIRFVGHTAPILTMAFDPENKVLASGSEGGELKLWSTRLRRPLITLQRHTGPIRGVAFSQDGRYLASGGTSSAGCGELILWEALPVAGTSDRPGEKK